MKFTSILLAIALLVSCASASSLCLGSAGLSPRNDSGASWNDGNYNFQIYDVALANTVSCDLDSLVLRFIFPDGASISDYWNMFELGWAGQWIVNATSLHVTNSAIIPVGIAYSASVGFILRFPNDTDLANMSMSLISTQCRACGSAPTSSPPSTSGSPPSSPSSAPSSAPIFSSCVASAGLMARASAQWNDGSSNFQIYDLIINNTGSCAMDSVGLQFVFSDNASISSIWNMQEESSYYLIGTSTLHIAAGHWLEAGASSAAAGFILQYPMTAAYALSASVSVYGASCDSSCTASSTSGSVSIPSSSPSDPLSSSPSGPSSCQVTASVGIDPATSSWVDAQGQTRAVYRVSVTNTGSCPLSALTLSFSPINVVTSWNLQSVVGGYGLQGFGDSILVGQANAGAGFVLADVAGPISVLSTAPTCLPC